MTGQPQAETLVNVDILILDDKANGSYNKYKLYHGGFNEISNLEAYTKVPDGRGFKKIKVTDFKTQNSPSEGIFYDDVKEQATQIIDELGDSEYETPTDLSEAIMAKANQLQAQVQQGGDNNDKVSSLLKQVAAKMKVKSETSTTPILPSSCSFFSSFQMKYFKTLM